MFEINITYYESIHPLAEYYPHKGHGGEYFILLNHIKRQCSIEVTIRAKQSVAIRGHVTLYAQIHWLVC